MTDQTSPETASALADEIDAALTEYLATIGEQTYSTRRIRAVRALNSVLWDNKAGIIAHLRTVGLAQRPALTREDVDAFIQALNPIQQVYLDNGHIQASWHVRGLEFFTLNFTEAFAALSQSSTVRPTVIDPVESVGAKGALKQAIAEHASMFTSTDRPTAKDLAAEPLEPAAWRWKYKGDHSFWTVGATEPSDNPVICEPLYAVPSPNRGSE